MSNSHWRHGRALGAALAIVLVLPVSSAFAQDDSVSVDVQAISYAPPVIHVAPGTTVVFTNDTPVQHTVTADDASFDSGRMRRGDSFSQLFETPGVYQFFCTWHGAAGLKGMAGAVVVDDPNLPPEAQPDVQLPTQLQRDTNPTQYAPDH